ncbi:hypothetical protein V8C35DRAFT_151302 [Trichoderma chlorosporum]
MASILIFSITPLFVYYPRLFFLLVLFLGTQRPFMACCYGGNYTQSQRSHRSVHSMQMLHTPLFFFSKTGMPTELLPAPPCGGFVQLLLPLGTWTRGDGHSQLHWSLRDFALLCFALLLNCVSVCFCFFGWCFVCVCFFFSRVILLLNVCMNGMGC